MGKAEASGGVGIVVSPELVGTQFSTAACSSAVSHTREDGPNGTSTPSPFSQRDPPAG